MNLWTSVLLGVALVTSYVQGDWCRDRLDRCAQMRDQIGFSYELGNQPVYQWVSNLLLIDPSQASVVCRDWKFYVNTLTCIRNRLKEHVCWSQHKYWYADRYVPDEKTLTKSMETFCDPAKRMEKINMQNCMILNAQENRKKEACLRREEAKTLERFGAEISDNSMCSFFHKRLNCYLTSFGSICKTTLQENVQAFNAITMQEYFDPLRKSSICHITDGASGLSFGLAAMLICVFLHWFL